MNFSEIKNAFRAKIASRFLYCPHAALVKKENQRPEPKAKPLQHNYYALSAQVACMCSLLKVKQYPTTGCKNSDYPFVKQRSHRLTRY